MLNNILLMTATIAPKSGVPNLVRNDPQVRLRDYEQSLRFYLSFVGFTINKIVFAENSNFDVSSLMAIAEEYHMTDRIEFLSFDGLDYPPGYDRGYGEFKLVDYVMEHSQTIKANPEAIIWKVTGRYMVRNLIDIVNGAKHFDIYCNCRNTPKRVMDMYLMAWTVRTHETFLKGIYHKLKMTPEMLNKGMVPEELFRTLLDNAPRGMRIIKRFNTTADVNGVRGGDNTNYSTDNAWKFYIRNVAKKCLPWVWI